MEFDRIKLNSDKSESELIKSLEGRLKSASPHMLKIESIAADILVMMHEKTRQYGGNKDENKSLEYLLWKAMLDGVERKSNRLEQLTINSSNGDLSSQEALLDTYIDCAAYSLMALVSLHKHIGNKNET